jgi:hypothetical protein
MSCFPVSTPFKHGQPVAESRRHSQVATTSTQGNATVSPGGESAAVARTLPVISLALSALAWLGVLILSVGTTVTWNRDLVVLLLALIALICGVVAVIYRRRSWAAWAAFAVSVIFPIWLWQLLSNLGGDAF